jgi:hypothetical protein
MYGVIHNQTATLLVKEANPFVWCDLVAFDLIKQSLFAVYLVYQDFHSHSGTVFCLSFSIGRYPFCVSSILSHNHFLSPSRFSQFPFLSFNLRFILFVSSWSPIPCVQKHLQLELRTYSTIRNPCLALSAKQITPYVTVAVVLPRFCLRFRNGLPYYLFRWAQASETPSTAKGCKNTVLFLPQTLQGVIWQCLWSDDW